MHDDVCKVGIVALFLIWPLVREGFVRMLIWILIRRHPNEIRRYCFRQLLHLALQVANTYEVSEREMVILRKCLSQLLYFYPPTAGTVSFAYRYIRERPGLPARHRILSFFLHRFTPFFSRFIDDCFFLANK